MKSWISSPKVFRGDVRKHGDVLLQRFIVWLTHVCPALHPKRLPKSEMSQSSSLQSKRHGTKGKGAGKSGGIKEAQALAYNGQQVVRLEQP